MKKKDNTTHFLSDFRGVNDVKHDTYPLPLIQEALDKMNGSRYWCTMSAASAYWSIPLSETEKEKAALAAPSGKFKFNVMKFGLSQSSICLLGLRRDKILSYMDNIAVFSTTFEEHVRDLKTVLECLKTAY